MQQSFYSAFKLSEPINFLKVLLFNTFIKFISSSLPTKVIGMVCSVTGKGVGFGLKKTVNHQNGKAILMIGITIILFL
jgi:hypothetical protein